MMAGEPTYEELKKKVAELEAELAARREKTPGRTAPGARPSSRARFSDIFDLDKIQEMLDAFAGAAGVSAVLTEPDGRPITRPSNFCRLCGEVIRKTEIGAASCARSCCMIDRFNPGGPAIQPCSSAGLWQAGARVRVEDETLAHLIIGQVRLDDQGDEEMMKYAGEIGADEETYGRALAEIPVTPRERFRQVAAAAFHIADQMSETARRTLRLNQLSARRERDREGARRAEKKARRAERTLNAIAKAAPDIIYRLDRNGKISFISDAVKRYGWAPEELIGRDPLELVHPDDREAISKEIHEKRTADRRTTGREVRIVAKSVAPGDDGPPRENAGEVRTFLLDAEGLYASDPPTPNSFRGTRGWARDITEQKRAQDALMHSEELLRDVADNMPGVVFQFYARPGRDYGFYYVNELTEALFGIDHDKTGFFERFASHVHEQDRERFIASVDEAVNGRKPWTFEGRFVKPGGETRWFRGKAAPAHRETEVVFNGLVMDVTTHVLADETLRESRERLDLALEINNASVWELDLDTDRITLENKAYRTLGYTREEIGETGKGLESIIHPDDLARIRAETRAHLAGETPIYDNEHRLRKKNGGWIWVHNRAKVVKWGKDGRARTMIGATTDISDRKMAEKEKEKFEYHFRQAEKMRAIGTLAGGIAHDFNNILTVILGQAQLIELLDARNAPGLQSRIRDLTAASHRAAALVKQILTFSRRAEYKKEPIQISPIIKEVLKFLRASIPSTVEIRWRIQEGEKRVLADPIHIHQILMNLCTNATHSMWKSGGALNIELEEVYMDEEAVKPFGVMKPGWRQKLMVSDTGPGIDPGLLKKIFDPYFTTKKEGEGAGLGLSVVHGIVKDHGGHITVLSDPGRGSTFTVLLPCIDDDLVEREAETAALIPAGSERILYVEDEEIQARTIGKILETHGYQVEICPGGPEALKTFASRSHEFGLVISDLAMPGMTGLELAREILSLRPDIPVIIFTGFSEKDTNEKAKAIGVRKVLTKPIELRALAGIIRKELDRPPPWKKRAAAAESPP